MFLTLNLALKGELVNGSELRGFFSFSFVLYIFMIASGFIQVVTEDDLECKAVYTGNTEGEIGGREVIRHREVTPAQGDTGVRDDT